MRYAGGAGTSAQGEERGRGGVENRLYWSRWIRSAVSPSPLIELAEISGQSVICSVPRAGYSSLSASRVQTELVYTGRKPSDE